MGCLAVMTDFYELLHKYVTVITIPDLKEKNCRLFILKSDLAVNN